VRIELPIPDLVKRYVNEVMGTWMRNLKLTAHQETAIGRARCAVLNLTPDHLLVWAIDDEI
jgi:hypothetical protein